MPAAIEAILFYFVPFMIAGGYLSDKHGGKGLLKVFLINLLAGWTGIGWIIALIVAVRPSLEATSDATIVAGLIVAVAMLGVILVAAFFPTILGAIIFASVVIILSIGRILNRG